MKIIWDISNKCNLKCRYCAATSIEHGLMSSIDYEKVINNFGDMVDEVVLLGGEPFLAPNIMNLLKLLTNNKIGISIITNGQADTKILTEIVNNNVTIKNLQVSIDGFESNNDINRGIGSYTRAISFLKKVSASDMKLFVNNVGVSIVLTKQNNDSIIDFIEFLLKKVNVDNVFIAPVVIENNQCLSEEIKLAPDEELDALLKISRFVANNHVEDRISIDIPTPLVAEYLNAECGTHFRIEPKGCKAVDEELYCNAHGKIGACRYSDKIFDIQSEMLTLNYAKFNDFYIKKMDAKQANCECIYKDICNSCIFASEAQLMKQEICKAVERRYNIEKMRKKQKYALSQPVMLCDKNNEYLALFPNNIKQELTREGYLIYKEIENSAKTADTIGKNIGIDSNLVYRYLVQNFTKKSIRRV